MTLRFLLWAAAILLVGFLLIGISYCGYQEVREIQETPGPR